MGARREGPCVAHPRDDEQDGRQGCLVSNQAHGLWSRGHVWLLFPRGHQQGLAQDRRLPAPCGEAEPWLSSWSSASMVANGQSSLGLGPLRARASTLRAVLRLVARWWISASCPALTRVRLVSSWLARS